MSLSNRFVKWILAHEWVVIGIVAPALLLPRLMPSVAVISLIVLLSVWTLRYVFSRCVWPITPFNVALIPLFLMAAVGSLITPSPEWSIPKLTGLVLGIAIFRATLLFIETERDRQLALLFYIGLTTILMSIGVLGSQWGTHKIRFLRDIVVQSMPQLRFPIPELPGGTINPNQLALLPLFTLPIILAYMAEAPYALFSPIRLSRRMTLAAYILTIGTNIFVLFISFARSAWVGMIIALLFMLVVILVIRQVSIPSGMLIWTIWLVIVPSIYLAIILVPVSFTHLFLTNKSGGYSLIGRQEAWQHAMGILQDFPITGIGFGTFRVIAPAYYPFLFFRPQQFISDAHNTFLQIGSDTGIMGLVAYIALLIIACYIATHLFIYDSSTNRALGIGVASSLVGIHSYGILNSVALGSKPGILFWLLLGILAKSYSLKVHHQNIVIRHNHNRHHNILRYPFYIVSVFIVVFFLLMHLLPMIKTNAGNLGILLTSPTQPRTMCPLSTTTPNTLNRLHSPVVLPMKIMLAEDDAYSGNAIDAAYGVILYFRCTSYLSTRENHLLLQWVRKRLSPQLAGYLLDIFPAWESLLSDLQAIEILEILLSQAAQHVNGHYRAARLYYRIEKWEQAVFHARLVLSMATDVKWSNVRLAAYRILVMSLLQQHNWNALDKLLWEMEVLSCGVPEEYMDACRDLVFTLNRSIQREQNRLVGQLLRRARHAFANGQWENAIQYAKQVTTQKLDTPPGRIAQIWAYNILIRSLVMEGKYNEAKIYLKEFEIAYKGAEGHERRTFQIVHSALTRLLYQDDAEH